MKPIFALASMAIGASAMTTASYVAFNPNAFLSRTPRVASQTLAVVGAPAPVSEPIQSAERVEPETTALTPIRITGRRKPAAAKPAEEKALTACSDWRSLGPSATRSAGSDSEHKVKLLCPSGTTAQQIFMAEVRRPEPLNKRW